MCDLWCRRTACVAGIDPSRLWLPPNTDSFSLHAHLPEMSMIPMSAELAWRPVPEILTNHWNMAQLIPKEIDCICTVGFLMCRIKFTVCNQESSCPGSLMYAVISAGMGLYCVLEPISYMEPQFFKALWVRINIPWFIQCLLFREVAGWIRHVSIDHNK